MDYKTREDRIGYRLSREQEKTAWVLLSILVADLIITLTLTAIIWS